MTSKYNYSKRRGGMEPDKERDFNNRFPKPPKMPDDVFKDPAKRKQWDEYWRKARDEWSCFLKDIKNQSIDGEQHWLRKKEQERKKGESP